MPELGALLDEWRDFHLLKVVSSNRKRSQLKESPCRGSYSRLVIHWNYNFSVFEQTADWLVSTTVVNH